MPSPPHAKALAALLTASAGFVTWRAARSPKARIEREGRIADRPFVIPAPLTGTVEIALSGQDLSMQLWNVGREAAIVDTLSLRDESGDLLTWGVTRCPVDPGAAQDLRFPLPQRVPEDGERCSLRITYRAPSGARYETESELRIGRPACECRNFTRTGVGAAS